MLSCRVQGKLLEAAFFSHLAQRHYPRPCNTIWVNFRKTERNAPALQVLDTFGFRPCDPGPGALSHGMVLSDFSHCPDKDVVRVQCNCSQEGRRATALPDTLIRNPAI